ncbi:helix-turn-helix domain-containing protein [Hymenobacter sp. BT559]|uniref:AlbA family DNA-binding domain-containing protein n=1 Tax=Hymenobacter sp. BT559 TaxID=2795729 RepID=UPI0018EC2372|nr:ATP-binding protein [Hymenobacter sp. BT559]MBJ6143682.1 ATP-binding protein [Hymenobacter sp. BT559]
MDLRELIEYENENTNLDFKKVPYRKEMFGELLKDLIAMANADTRGDRFIIIGVKHYPDGRRDILGIDNFIDDAIYQKLVNDNIEPELRFEYSAFDFDDKKLAYFRIYSCVDQPYMMKKDYSVKDNDTIQRGESFVRKGSFKTRLLRRDIDRMFANKLEKDDFKNFISVELDCDSGFGLYESGEFILPSRSARKRIEEVIKQKEKELENLSRLQNRIKEGPLAELDASLIACNLPLLMPSNPFGSYEQRDLSTLRENLAKVTETYREDDAYCVFEEQSSKINFKLINAGEKYIEDVSLEFSIRGDFDFLIAPEKFSKPSSFGPTIPLSNWERLEYPEVIENNNSYIIHSSIGQLKHGIPSKAFKVPIRIFLPLGCFGKKLIVDIKIFGANIAKHINKFIEIDILQNTAK